MMILCVVLIGMIITSIAGVGLMAYYNHQSQDDKLTTIIDQNTENLLKSLAASHADTETIKRGLQCVGTYLAQSNRDELIVTDLDTCTFKNRRTGESGSLPVHNNFTPLPESKLPDRGSNGNNEQEKEENNQDQNPGVIEQLVAPLMPLVNELRKAL